MTTNNKNDDDKDAAAATADAAQGCPVMMKKGAVQESHESRKIWNWFGTRASGASSRTAAASSAATEDPATDRSTCPVARGGTIIPPSIEEAAKHPQTPAAGQLMPLSTQRVTSSIPRGDKPSSGIIAPSHQPANSANWQYPSEQQFYNAMFRKGYRPPVESIPSVLQIHNAVNERSWAEVRKWERDLHGNGDPRLAKFIGRPKDLSPRAWFNSNILMTQAPFDRHDCLESSMGRGTNALKPPSMYIDVRPALDNPSAAVDRMTMFMREILPGLTAVYDSFKSSPSSPVE
ncbi:hypothetical protein THAOC_14741 [Thalassiosira oceanica]|uniref:Holocytochrome c-type synthase n=1 Tax=Thalassiosira oceanica TaxID=159749 RepID=K0SEF6_THAOC|nr:hypothetical protein THAOC_14741 [Thalassiosira oceanica]|eukprot:EJK64518.1 hypothetical protein THAOC_14741 [Thalassiosira oceanica]